MPPITTPFGPDSMATPAYFVSNETDPAYRAWRAEHPDAFVAGTWARAEPHPQAMPPDSDQTGSTDPGQAAEPTSGPTAPTSRSVAPTPPPRQRRGHYDRAG